MAKALATTKPVPASEIVIIDRGKAFWTTSIDVAEKFGKRHDNVLRDIQNVECSREFAHLNFEVSEYRDSTGRALPMYLLSRDGFTFLAMGFKGKRSAQWKERYIAAFNAMEQRILQYAAEMERQARVMRQQASLEWQQNRAISKAQRRELTDTIRDILIPHARALGSTAPEGKFYLSYSKMIKGSLFDQAADMPGDYLDLLTIRQLNVLAVAEFIADGVIQEEVAKGTPYKGPEGIFEKVKARIVQYAATVGILHMREQERLEGRICRPCLSDSSTASCGALQCIG